MKVPLVAPRITTIDCARGLAMVFVCLAHFVDGLRDYASGVDGRVLQWIGRASMIASPTFVVVSGLTVGILAAGRATAFNDLRVKLIDRSLFTLTVGHLALVLAEGSLIGHFEREIRTVFITDVVAVSTLAATVLIRSVSPRGRLAISSAAFMLGWVVWWRWEPAGLVLRVAGEMLAGPHRSAVLAYGFPLLMWFGVHQAATVAGERLASSLAGGERRLAVLIAAGGACALGLGVAGSALMGAVAPLAPSDLSIALRSAVQKLPPSPVYLLVNGGAGLLVIGALAACGPVLPALQRAFATVGRASFFSYVVQYAVFTTLVPLLAIPVGGAWPIYFLALLALTFALAARWDAMGGNRFLTVGVKLPWRFRPA